MEDFACLHFMHFTASPSYAVADASLPSNIRGMKCCGPVGGGVQQHFNKAVLRTRCVTESSFGLLKGHFKITTRLQVNFSSYVQTVW
jgi:hypothetical protein